MKNATHMQPITRQHALLRVEWKKLCWWNCT